MSIDCCSQKGLMPFQQAVETLLGKVNPVKQTEVIPVERAIGRVLAEEVCSPINVPGYDNSAMDGYAVRADELASTDTLLLAGKSFAGQPFDGEWPKASCIRIMTGAMLPKGCDAVVMQENTSQQGNSHVGESIVFSIKPGKGDHLRYAGDDIQSNQTIFLPGREVSVPDLGLLASLGLKNVSVFRKLKVAVFSTGDEIQAPGKPLEPGQIYDSNRFTTIALLHKLGVEVIDFGVLPDQPSVIRDTLIAADQQADVVITSGGVSVGEADYIKPIVEELGKLELWKVAIKPGKPFAYGKLPSCHFIGLPGNPVSALVTLYQLALPMLHKMRGTSAITPVELMAKTRTRLHKRPGRLDFQRGVVSFSDQGEAWVESSGQQGSGILSSMSVANCFIILDESLGEISEGQTVKVQLFNSLLHRS